MLNTMTVRAKLFLLIAVSVLALLIVMVIGMVGMNKGAESLRLLGKNRMPSVQALLTISQAQTALRSANRAIDSLAPYTEEDEELTRQLKRKGDFNVRLDKA